MNSPTQAFPSDTIAAIATAPGRGGVGIVRLSGPSAAVIAQSMLGFNPKPRYAHFSDFRNQGGELLDQGIALFFPGPHSFTGEDVFELQGHGGPVVLNQLLNTTLALGARLARPGEFSERAFLNDKLDLTQAEAIADLIDAASESAARNAVNSLQGQFKTRVDALVERVIQLRIYVEAAIDFPEEEIDFLADGKVSADLDGIITATDTLLAQAQQGAILREGLHLVIAGKPNAGKSSLLNALAERESAIVTAIAGTTRDILREQILVDGLPVHISDTAGLRDTADPVETLGVARAREEIAKAGLLLVIIDGSELDLNHLDDALAAQLDALRLAELAQGKLALVVNKCDLFTAISAEQWRGIPLLAVSAKTGQGLAELRGHIKACAGWQSAGEGQFTARARHTDALQQALNLLRNGSLQMAQHQAGELLAEDLRQAAEKLHEITGKFSSDDLLGRIFSSFCIGK